MIFKITLLIIAWLVCGFLGTGWMVAEFARRYPSIAKRDYRHNLGMAVTLNFLFPFIGAPISYFTSGFGEHGWSLRPKELFTEPEDLPEVYAPATPKVSPPADQESEGVYLDKTGKTWIVGENLWTPQDYKDYIEMKIKERHQG